MFIIIYYNPEVSGFNVAIVSFCISLMISGIWFLIKCIFGRGSSRSSSGGVGCGGGSDSSCGSCGG